MRKVFGRGVVLHVFVVGDRFPYTSPVLICLVIYLA